MSLTHQEIQQSYIDHLKRVLPEVVIWWETNANRKFQEYIGSTKFNDFEIRWSGGPACHPSIIHIFRTYYFKVEGLNFDNEAGVANAAEAEPPGSDQLWGEDSLGAEADVVHPVQLLIHDLEAKEPELHRFMLGLSFVPTGMGTNIKDDL